MDSFHIREARGADRDAIGILWRELMNYHQALDSRFSVAEDGEAKYIRHALDMMRSRSAYVLVAVDIATGAVIGYIMAELQTRPAIAMPGLYGFVSDICVTQSWRHRGVGRALWIETRQWFVSRHAKAVELYISEENKASAAFWAEMGLTPFLKLLHLDL